MRRFAFLAVVCLAFVACGDSTGPVSVPGRYALVSVDGSTVAPFLSVQVRFGTGELMMAHIQLNADGTCTASVTWRTTELYGVTTDSTETRTCTWTLNDTAIIFRYPELNRIAGSLIDGTIDILTSGHFFVYRK